MGIVIEKPGILTTVQDAGRFGYQQYGVSPAGPMDTRSFQLANILAGNHPDEGVLEFTVAGPSLRFEQDNVIAVSYTHLDVYKRQPYSRWRYPYGSFHRLS